jgi:hypothetical protein
VCGAFRAGWVVGWVGGRVIGFREWLAPDVGAWCFFILFLALTGGLFLGPKRGSKIWAGPCAAQQDLPVIWTPRTGPRPVAIFKLKDLFCLVPRVNLGWPLGLAMFWPHSGAVCACGAVGGCHIIVLWDALGGACGVCHVFVRLRICILCPR